MRKKASILLVLTIFLYGCSEELSETNYNTDINLIQSEKTLEKSDDFGSSNKSNNQTPKVDNGNNAQTSELNFEIYQPEELTVYVDYTDAVNNLPPDELSEGGTIIPLEDRIANFISEYETEMSNNFTIFNIVESNSCDYIYKWIVDKDEYNNFWGPGDSNTGINGVKQKKRKDEDEEVPFDPDPVFDPDPYSGCF